MYWSLKKMNEVRTLLEEFWICKATDKETYYRVKRGIPEFQRFIREQLGWKLVHTENLLYLPGTSKPRTEYSNPGYL